jgi:asparagine synthase (glutamine-hydrolysing)
LGAVGHLFASLATPATTSIVKGIEKLQPAHVAVASEGRPLRATRYWDVQFKPNEHATEDELVEQLRAELTDAVTLHQVSDVPVGAFLSGGIDSSAVVGMMAKPAAGRFKTFSIGFAESGFDELQYARQVAAQFGTDHHDLVLRPDVVRIVEDLTWYLDEPFGDTSAIPTYMVSKLAAEHVKVVLSGDGGDEIFAGYDKYVVEGRERQHDRIPRPLRQVAGTFGALLPEGTPGRRFLRHMALDGPARYLDASIMFHDDEARRLFNRDAFEQVARTRSLGRLVAAAQPRRRRLAGRRAVPRYPHVSAARHPDQGRSDDDGPLAGSAAAAARSQAGGVCRYGAGAIPPEGWDDEVSLQESDARNSAGPDHHRPKHGFAVPLARWFRGDLSAFAQDLLLSNTCRQRGIFNEGYVKRCSA